MQLSYKYRAYPDMEVEARLFYNIDLCRWLYNMLLGILNEHREDWELSKQDTQDAVTQIKLYYPFLNDVHSKVLQMVNYTLWSNVKSLSKLKKKGSNNRRKARKLVARLHEKIGNVRNNRNHQVSRKYVDRYDVIVVEDLDITGMVNRQNKISKLSPKARRTLRRNILDAGWGDFVQKLEYKATMAGKLLLKVCPTNTTQRCSHCGAIVYKDISQRTHKCLYCGLEMDRDDNATINIRNEGISLIRIRAMVIRAGNRPEPDGETCLYPDNHPGKYAPMKQEAMAFRPW